MAATRAAYIFTTSILFLLLLLLIPVALAKDHRTHAASYLARGSSVSIEDGTIATTTTILASPNGLFGCGFYKVATNAFVLSIWFTGSSARTVAWTANRDAPVNGRGSRLAFRKDGGLALLDYGGMPVWSTNTTATGASRAELLDSGSLVVLDPDGRSLWTSFDSPTDTLLPSQPMTRNIKLVSASARGLLYSGFYTLYFDSDNVLRLIYNGPEINSIYWPDPFNKPWGNGRTTYNSSRHAVLEQSGQFVSSDNFTFEASDLGDMVMRRLTLDYDGNLRLYSLNQTSGHWSVSWMAFRRVCNIHGLCGQNSICKYSYMPKLECSCVEGFEVVDASDWSKGCRRKANMTARKDKQRKQEASINATQIFSFRKLAKTDFYGYDLAYAARVSFLTCKLMCLDNVDCQAFGYRQGEGKCYPKVILFNGKNFPRPYNDIYLKIPKGASSLELASTANHTCRVHEKEANASSEMFKDGTSKFKFGYFLSSALTLLFVEVILIITGCWVVHKWERRPEIIDEGYMIISSQFRIFSYKELQKATNCFQEELGSGGSGAVYKGVLDDERKVAVKKLNDVIQGEQEFRWVVEGEEEVEMADICSIEILKEKLASEDQSWLLEFVDHRLDGDFNHSEALMMLKIAVSCVEEERSRRPNMSHVVETLLSLVE
ncbi:hypothetical protein ZWY2020_050499 [Hordeum vulgare]|nr:hypothetical protein ZWY2020_050499 [Hordeum vulgare]